MIMSSVKKMLPGILMCSVISMVGVFLGGYFPKVGGATFTILLGMLVGNTLATNKDRYGSGSKFAEGQLLTYSIALLGGTLSFGNVAQIGIPGLSFIVIQMAFVIAFCIFMGKKLGFSQDFSYLMASGNAVCGTSAIAATAPAIRANEQDKLISITVVNLTGSILMIVMPLVAAVAFNSELLRTSAIIGGVLQSIGQVVASASMVNEPVKELAMIFKIIRVIFIVAVVVILAGMKDASEAQAGKKVKFSFKQIPWYVSAFFFMCILYSLGLIPVALSHIFKIVCNTFEIVALAGIGMRVDIRELVRQGPRVTMFGLSIGCMQILLSLSLIYIIYG